MIDALSYTREELAQWLRDRSYNPIHAQTLFRRIYGERNRTAHGAPSLPQGLEEDFAAHFALTPLKVLAEQLSKDDGTVKFLYALPDDNAAIESVLMPEAGRITVCVSSQVGCAQACSFCHTGRMGLSRNLSPGEIVAQVYWANVWLHAHPEWLQAHGYEMTQRVTNVVFMGMGEPLDNTEAVITAIRIFIDPFGLHLAPKRISVSTAGVLDGLHRLIAARLGVSLAFSMHSPDNSQRSQLMKINRRYPLEEVLAVLDTYSREVKREFFVQYTLIAGVNDQPVHMQRLVERLAGMRVKVNLIPYNLVAGNSFSQPQLTNVLACYNVLISAGIRCMIRFSKGQDIAAACGQLVTKERKNVASVPVS